MNFGRSVAESSVSISENEQAAIDDLVKSIRNIYGERLISVMLMGSRSRGDHRKDSDWDFLVFLDECDYDIEVPKMKALAEKLPKKYDTTEYSISPLSEEQFLGLDKKYPGITDNFRRDAVVLWRVFV